MQSTDALTEESRRLVSRTGSAAQAPYDQRVKDSVDLIQEQLTAQHPGINNETAAIVGRIMRLSRIMQTLTDQVLAEHTISRAEFDIVSLLIRSDRPLSATELARSLWTSGAGTTKRISKLLAAGLITRTANPDDARSVLITPTASARAGFAPTLHALAKVESSMLGEITPDTRRRLAEDLRTLLLHLESSQRN